MAEIKLPKKKTEVKNFNPKLMVLFGKPKSGKSTLMAALENNLILDLEDGYRALSVMKVDITNYTDMRACAVALKNEIKELGKFPYDFVTIDNASRLEEMALPLAAKLYRETSMGQSWGMKKDAKGMIVRDPQTGKPMPDPKADVRLLPNGAGYLYIRNAVKSLLDLFKPLAPHIILVAHVKDKQINVNGEEMSEMTVDLAGKLGDIICGEADAIGYVFREGKKTFISFEGGDKTIREARPQHLRGKKICVAEASGDELKVDMSQIYLPTL